MTPLETFAYLFWSVMLLLGICVFITIIRGAARNQARRKWLREIGAKE